MQRQETRIHKLKNLLHSGLLILGMASIAAACAWTIWGWDGVVWAFFGVGLALILSPSIPPDFVLSMYRARLLARAEFPQGYEILQGIAERAGLPGVPRLYYIPSSLLNAFAVGNQRLAAIAVTDGLVRTLSPRELTGILAHEISHIVHNDLWIMNLADTMSRITGLFSYFGMFFLILNLPLFLAGATGISWLLIFLLVFAPTLMSLLQLALSRTREFEADLGAAELTGDPVGLASALEKLERYQGRFWEEYFFPGRRIPDPSLLRTHPPTQQRIRRLLELKQPAVRAADLHSPRPISMPESLHQVKEPPQWRWPGLWY